LHEDAAFWVRDRGCDDGREIQPKTAKAHLSYFDHVRNVEKSIEIKMIGFNCAVLVQYPG
jgi:hypothetical protein|tara:strand:+ start:4303 stop:4482 length:180 start_codon:yes stop_codon:yes gene_type:complete